MSYDFDKVHESIKVRRRNERINQILRNERKVGVERYEKVKSRFERRGRGGYGTGLFKTNRSNLNKLLR